MTQSTSDQRRPFLSAPCPQRYFAAGSIEEARQRIVRAIARNEGPAMLIGGAGTGKSLLLAVLQEQFGPRVAVVTLEGAQLVTRRALLQTILCELGLAYRGMDEGELRLALTHYLRGLDPTPSGVQESTAKPPTAGRAARRERRLVLLVDEADALPVRLLEELRVLTNVAAEGLPLVSLVLAGGPILEERFADPQLDVFAQRIAARCYLAPLGREETLQYVRSQVAAAGIKPERLFTAEALEAIYSATGGLPRLINQLGDQLAWMAEETGCTPLDAALVQQAWSDLQQLPAPWNTEGPPQAAAPAGRDAASVIEFGELDAVVVLGEPVLDGQVVDDVLLDDSDLGAADEEAEDEHPASIPFASARTPRLPFEEVTPDETLAATEELLYSYDELELSDETFGEVESVVAEGPPQVEVTLPAAENPFAEPFEEEEIVVDPYRAFEADLLRSAPQVVNRLDRSFAADLHRCVQRAVEARVTVTPRPAVAAGTAAASHEVTTIDETSTIDMPEDDELVAIEPAPVRLHSAAAPAAASAGQPVGDVLVVEDDEEPAPQVVQGRQFRRLFTALETATGASRLG